MALTRIQHIQKLFLFSVIFKIPSITIEKIISEAIFTYERIEKGINLPSKPKFPHDDLDILLRLVKKLKPMNVLELGTAHGNTVANICANSSAKVYTINALPEQIAGNAITFSLSENEIGSIYRDFGFAPRVVQIYENTLTMDLSKYKLPLMDLIIIDACHDFNFVINDFLKVKEFVKPSGLILFHDTFPLRPKGHLGQSTWAAMTIRSRGYDIYHIKNSWWGVWQKPSGNEKHALPKIIFNRFFPEIPNII